MIFEELQRLYLHNPPMSYPYLIHDIIVGIHKLAARRDSEKKEEEEEKKVENSENSSSITITVHGKKETFLLKVYAPREFAHIRQLFGITRKQFLVRPTVPSTTTIAD